MKGNMKKTILSYPDHLDDLFNENVMFSVHSSFKNTINLNYRNTLISLQHKDLMLTPMSICLDLTPSEFRNICFDRSNIVYIKNRTLYINEVSFEMSHTKQRNLQLTENFNKMEVQNLQKELNHYLLNLDRNGEMIKVFQMLNNYSVNKLSLLGEYFYRVFKKFSSTRINDLYEQLHELIGVGEGLTPSGDDFLCGLIASTYFINTKDMMSLRLFFKEMLPLHMNKTTDISRAYLLNALDGRFMEGLVRIYESSLKKEDVVQILNEISGMGHSSGTDFLLGLNFGLKLGGKKE